MRQLKHSILGDTFSDELDDRIAYKLTDCLPKGVLPSLEQYNWRGIFNINEYEGFVGYDSKEIVDILGAFSWDPMSKEYIMHRDIDNIKKDLLNWFEGLLNPKGQWLLKKFKVEVGINMAQHNDFGRGMLFNYPSIVFGWVGERGIQSNILGITWKSEFRKKGPVRAV